MSFLVYPKTLTLWELKTERYIRTLKMAVVRYGIIGKGKNTGLEVSQEIPDCYHGQVLGRR
jgi:hypothetical protein